MGYYLYSVLLTFVGVFVYLSCRDEQLNTEIVKHRNIVITGASTGIGEALTYEYAKLGANVFITARREHILKQVVQKCRSINPNGKYGYYAADLGNYKNESLVLIEKAWTFLGGIDTLIINHIYYGKAVPWRGTKEDLEMFEEMNAVNLNSYIHIASHALPHLKSASNGRLGIISSLFGKMSMPLMTAYCGAKFAMDGFFSSLRDELIQAKSNVTVTLGFLGPISTQTIGEVWEEAFKSFGEKFVKNKREYVFGQPTETAKEVIRATETGQRELYYPKLYASRFVTMPASWVSIVRHMWPSLVEMVEFEESIY